MYRFLPLIFVCIATALPGCRTSSANQAVNPGTNATGASSGSPNESTSATSSPPAQTVAFINGRPVLASDLMPVLIEASGGQALAERLLDQAISQRLQQRTIKVTPEMIQAEQQYLLRSLHADANQAQRLLDEIRQRRGLGEKRFTALLARNAGMRALVKDEVQVSDVAVQQAHEFEHGVRYELRLITTETLTAAADAVRRIKGGESFIDVAVKVSTDESRAQGGLLSPISPADPTYPGSLRSAMVRLAPGQVSDPVALDRGFAIIRLERKIEADGIRFDDVKEDLTGRVRRQAEAMLMERLARQLIAEADVTVLDPALQKAWNAQKQRAAELAK